MPNKTIFSQIKTAMQRINAVHVADTTAWNIYKNSFGSNSAVHKTIAGLPKPTQGYEYVAVLGAKGRSPHARSDIHIFLVEENIVDLNATAYRSYWRF